MARRAVGVQGFTLIEILLVVTIIGVLAALVVPRFVGRSQEARVAAAQQEIVGTLGIALDLFEQDVGRYPTEEEGLEILIEDRSNRVDGWRGPYLKSAVVPMDPWGNEYQFQNPSQLTNIATLYDLVSAGPDEQFGTEDDVTNHEKGTHDDRDQDRRLGRR